MLEDPNREVPMDQLRPEDLFELLDRDDGIRASIYLPTHRAGPETRQDPIRLKNLLRVAEERLIDAGLRDTDAQEVLKPAQDLLDDHPFWQYQGDGLALFMEPGSFRSFRLPLSFDELALVNRRYHVKPLLPLFAADTRFYVLAVSQNETRLLMGSRQSVTTLHLESIPSSLADALKFEEPEKQLQWHSGASTPGRRGGAGSRAGAGAERFSRRPAIFHGHGGVEDDTKDRVLRYFRMIDGGLREILRDERAPLLLAGVEYYFPIYREANTYPHLLSAGLPGNPEHLRPDELHDRAWAVLERHFADEQRAAAARVEKALAKARGSSDLAEVVQIALQGRVDTLFLAAGEVRWGSWDPDRGTVVLHDEQRNGDEDLLDLAAVQTIRYGGAVYPVAASEVPDGGPVAAAFRG